MGSVGTFDMAFVMTYLRSVHKSSLLGIYAKSAPFFVYFDFINGNHPCFDGWNLRMIIFKKYVPPTQKLTGPNVFF